MILTRRALGILRTIATAVMVLAPMHSAAAQDSTRGIGIGAASDTGLRVSRYHALLIGVAKYSDVGFGKLSGPVKDATSLRDLLIKRYRFAAEDVKVLRDPRKADILDELDRLSQVLGRNDNLLIFFAGHGGYDEERDQGFWMGVDARPRIRTSQLSNTELAQAIGAIRTRHTLLIADVCFGGSFRSGAESGLERLYAFPSRKIMTSGAKRELVPDKSVFLRAVLRYLESNQEPYLRAMRLFTDIQPAVLRNSRATPQYKHIEDVGDEGGEFLFPLRTGAGGGDTAGYIDPGDGRVRRPTRSGEDSLLTDPEDIVQSQIREFVQYIDTKDVPSLNPLNYTLKPGAEATWKENFITLVRDYLISATLVARPAVWVDDSDRLSHSEVAINVRYRDQVARGERRQKIRFSLEHALIGSTWYLTKVQILDKPPG